MLLDTFAWLEYFMGGARGTKVRQRMEVADVIYTCPMVIAELTSKLCRTLGEREATMRVEHVMEHAVIIDHTAEIGRAAGRIHQEMKARVPDFGMADAFLLAAARSRQVIVLTGDPHFAGVPDAEIL